MCKLFGKETIEELQQQYLEEKFAAEADEVYPREKGAIAKHASDKALAEALNATTAAPKKEGKPADGYAHAAATASSKTKEENIVKYNKFTDSFTLALVHVSTLNHLSKHELQQPARVCAVRTSSRSVLHSDGQLFHIQRFYR